MSKTGFDNLNEHLSVANNLLTEPFITSGPFLQCTNEDNVKYSATGNITSDTEPLPIIYQSCTNTVEDQHKQVELSGQDKTTPDIELNGFVNDPHNAQPINADSEIVDSASASTTMSDSLSSNDDQDYLSDGMDIRRVKVYELVDSRWTDRGTAFCSGDFDATSQEARLTARSEGSPSDIILSCSIRSTIVYHRQQATLIVWTETDGTDFALSFQDVEGCSEVWEFILDVQRHLSGRDDSLSSSSPFVGPHPSITTQQIIQSGRLPNPQMGIIGEIDKAIKMLGRTPTAKERICKYIVQEDYIKAMVDVFVSAEDLEDLETLHALCSCMQTILLLNDHAMYEHVLSDELWLGVVGMLEYDPEFPMYKGNYRIFLSQDSRFLQPIAIRDESVQRKVHQTYRLQYIKDVILARILDDSTFNVLNSCIIFNQIDIINHVQSDERFLKDGVSIFLDTEKTWLSDGLVSENRNVYSGSAEKFSRPLNNIFSKEEKDIQRKEVILLMQQLCIMGKNVQLPARVALFRTLVDRGVLFAVQWALSQPEKQIVSVGGEILASILDHDTLGIRTHVITQAMAQNNPDNVSEPTVGIYYQASASYPETLLQVLCKMLASSVDLALQNQLSDSLRALLEVSQGDTTNDTHHLLPTKIMPRPKDDPATERFLDDFYKNSVEVLFRPVLQDVPNYKNLSEILYVVPREKANLYLYLCDLLCAFAVQHSFRSHFFLLSSDIASHIASLLTVRDKHLRLAALRFFRMCLKLNNRNLFNYLMKVDVFGPIIHLTERELKRDNLLNSTCQEFFEHIRKENIKELINHTMSKYEENMRALSKTAIVTSTFEGLIRRWEINNEPAPEEIKEQSSSATRWGQNRLIESEEEDYFNKDDGNEEKFTGQAWHSETISNSLRRRKRQRISLESFNIGETGSSSPSIHLKSPLNNASPLSSLLDYNEDDDSATAELCNSSQIYFMSSRQEQTIVVPGTPVLAHREIRVLPGRHIDDEDGSVSDTLMNSGGLASTWTTRDLSPKLVPLDEPLSKSVDKRKRDEEDEDEDEDEDGFLGKLALKIKHPIFRPTGDEAIKLVNRATPQREEGPKRLKLKFGATGKATMGASSSPVLNKDNEGG